MGPPGKFAELSMLVSPHMSQDTIGKLPGWERIRGSAMASHMKTEGYQPRCNHIWGQLSEKHAVVPSLRAPIHPSIFPVPDNTSRRAGPAMPSTGHPRVGRGP